MQIQNSEIAETFNEVADLLEIEGANPFRIRAYRNAARIVLGLSENVSDIVHDHRNLMELPGIGKDLAAKISELVDTGHLQLLDEVKKHTPAALRDLLKIPALGPKRVQILFNSLGIKSLGELETAVKNKSILKIRGFGEKTRLSLLEGIKKLQGQNRSRLKLAEADNIASQLTHYLKQEPTVDQLVVAGSLRRRLETVGDLDLLATSKKPENVMKHFVSYEKTGKVISQGATRSTIVLKSGVQVDLRVVPSSSFGAALQYFTGSKAHNIALRTIALKRGLKINEYGVFKGSKKLPSRTESEVYRALKLPYIPSELRENNGEFENKIPALITLDDIRGDLHAHTSATDGLNTIEEMASAAQRLGYSYIAITDHSKSVIVAKGQDSRRLFKQIKEIDRINKTLKGITILKSAEVDILENGKLDLPDETLAQLDFTVCSIHSHFNLSPKKQTERILRAMKNPYFTILGHPTGRLIGKREPYAFDLERTIFAAKKLKKILEINSQPERMDLSDKYVRVAKDAGVKLSISTDAHNTNQLGYMNLGVGQARRGWVEKNDIINTLPLAKLKRLFRLGRISNLS